MSPETDVGPDTKSSLEVDSTRKNSFDAHTHKTQVHALLKRSDRWRTVALHRLAPGKGLVDTETRAVAWPRLLGVVPNEIEKDLFRNASNKTHKDSSVVDADCERSVWAFTSSWCEGDRVILRQKLKRVLNAVVCVHETEEHGYVAMLNSSQTVSGTSHDTDKNQNQKTKNNQLLHYYQGFHDVCSVLLLVLGEKKTYAVAERLALFHLRDCTRKTMTHVLDSLSLIKPLLIAVDAELYRHIFGPENESVLRSILFGDTNNNSAFDGLKTCIFAMAWGLTWHTHGLGDLCGGGGCVEPVGDDVGDGNNDESKNEEKKTKQNAHKRASLSDAYRLRCASRLMDLFLTSHPSMPLYLGVVAMEKNRDQLLTVDDPNEMHVHLSKLKVVPDVFFSENVFESVDDCLRIQNDAYELLEERIALARELYKEYPPDVLFKHAYVTPPIGCAHTVYPYKWLTQDSSDGENKTREKEFHKSPLPDGIARGGLYAQTVMDSSDTPWLRSLSPSQKALRVRSGLVNVYQTAVPKLIGVYFFSFIARDFLTAEKIERSAVFRTADVFTDPIFGEFFLWSVGYIQAVLQRALNVLGLNNDSAAGVFEFLDAGLGSENITSELKALVAVGAVAVTATNRGNLRWALRTVESTLSVTSVGLQAVHDSWYVRGRSFKISKYLKL